jgi:hypothetical protein
MTDEQPKNISWNDRLEEYFSSTGEKAHCYSWLHKKAEAHYANRRNLIDLPSIVISSVVGFLSAGSTSLFAGQAQTASIALGVSSLFVSMLTTMGAYFKFSSKSEAHRIASISYEKLYRFLNVEMSLPRHERMTAGDLLKTVKNEYDRLTEISPLVPESIIQEFGRKFEKIADVSKPEITNGLEKIVVFRSSSELPSLVHTPQNQPESALKTNPLFRAQNSEPLPPPSHLSRETAVGIRPAHDSQDSGLTIHTPSPPREAS